MAVIAPRRRGRRISRPAQLRRRRRRRRAALRRFHLREPLARGDVSERRVDEHETAVVAHAVPVLMAVGRRGGPGPWVA